MLEYRLGSSQKLSLAELILTYEAQGALKIPGDVFPLGTGGNAALGVAGCLVIFPATNVAYIFHNRFLLKSQFSSVFHRPCRLQ